MEWSGFKGIKILFFLMFSWLRLSFHSNLIKTLLNCLTRQELIQSNNNQLFQAPTINTLNTFLNPAPRSDEAVANGLAPIAGEFRFKQLGEAGSPEKPERALP